MQIQASITRTAHIRIRIHISCNKSYMSTDDGSSTYNDTKLDS